MGEKNPLQGYLDQVGKEIEAVLNRFLPPAETIPDFLHQGMQYALFGGGKRLRPALIFAATEALGGKRADSQAIAAAFELIHTYSLVHDDLPCMDDDDLRRGRATCHKVYGEAQALLIGDALLTQAFAVIAEHTSDPSRIGPLVAILARVAGSQGMVGGQALDLAGEEKEPSLELVKNIHLRKTAALLSGCFEAGAVVAGANDMVRETFARAGETLGLAFQVQDDVLDETADVAELGKTPGKDREAGKQTWPACVGMAASADEAKRLVSSALAELAQVGVETGPLVDLARFMVARRF